MLSDVAASTVLPKLLSSDIYSGPVIEDLIEELHKTSIMSLHVDSTKLFSCLILQYTTQIVASTLFYQLVKRMWRPKRSSLPTVGIGYQSYASTVVKLTRNIPPSLERQAETKPLTRGGSPIRGARISGCFGNGCRRARTQLGPKGRNGRRVPPAYSKMTIILTPSIKPLRPVFNVWICTRSIWISCFRPSILVFNCIDLPVRLTIAFGVLVSAVSAKSLKSAVVISKIVVSYNYIRKCLNAESWGNKFEKTLSSFFKSLNTKVTTYPDFGGTVSLFGGLSRFLSMFKSVPRFSK